MRPSRQSRTRFLVAIVGVAIAACGTTAPPSSTDAAPLPDVTLAADGLGDLLIGFPPTDVIAGLTARFGEPDLDSDWLATGPSPYGACPGNTMRAVGWGSLVTIFVNDGTDALGEYFYTYSYGYDYATNQGGVDPRQLDLVTDAGIGIGSSVAELTAAYGDRLSLGGDPSLDVWSFQIADSPLHGLVDGPDPEDTVTLIELAPGCTG
jgi:hypothetical protein